MKRKIEVREYIDTKGNSPYNKWFNRLNAIAAAKKNCNISDGTGKFFQVKSVSGGVHEYRIDFGPGYRTYFGNDGDLLVIMLAGGTKKHQAADIVLAKKYWQDYTNDGNDKRCDDGLNEGI